MYENQLRSMKIMHGKKYCKKWCFIWNVQLNNIVHSKRRDVMSQMAIGIPSRMGIRWILAHCKSRPIDSKTHWKVCNRMLFCHTRTTYIQGCKYLNKTIGKLEQNQSSWFPEMFKDCCILDAHCIFRNLSEPSRFGSICYVFITS